MADTSAAAQPDGGMSMLIMFGPIWCYFLLYGIPPTEQTCQRAPYLDELTAERR